jgi:predicted 3-demethylubiquinone-9 3-methyltransferase (glyoxalase superfamily)
VSKISPCIWFSTEAQQAAELYVSLGLPNSRIDRVLKSPADYPGGAKGDVLLVEFTLAGQTFLALNGGQPAQHSQAISFHIDCADQAEVDRLWSGLLANGGAEQQCGWITDRYGVSWQIIPAALTRLMSDPDPARAQRAMSAMMSMIKIDVSTLESAAG